jgi:hypothetical protein
MLIFCGKPNEKLSSFTRNINLIINKRKNTNRNKINGLQSYHREVENMSNTKKRLEQGSVVQRKREALVTAVMQTGIDLVLLVVAAVEASVG